MFFNKLSKTKKKKVSKLAKAKAAQTGPKIVVDKTFGMKNKNKSKKVQKYINDIKNTQKQKDEHPELNFGIFFY